ncbi:lipid II flippase Amj family protein [Acuticoccus sp. M5D2P5]|uniref:lipid II flippase Amj family protein n=1 Tax=Acuticoccus kalidii TaxID=2910977 RepID=UPI001F2EA7D0|nr:lipid II flippase Amj family protein [Acuticoccus kalidii]MCF3931915.1 lipid II flippase Amj family protein [Acuticoccus kalidii]
MDLQLAFIIALTFVIHLVGTLAYAFRIAGIRTRQIATAFALFNILVLVSRTANSFQGPFIAKRVETNILGQTAHNLAFDFSLVLFAATLATIVGGLMIPTCQRVAGRAINGFSRDRSVVKLVRRAITPHGVGTVASAFTVPRRRSLTSLRWRLDLPLGVVALNVFASALWTVGVLAAIYAGAIDPELRLTASTLSSVVNGVATILLFVIIDPYLAGLTDDVVKGADTEAHFRRVVIWMVGSRLAGTLLAQLLLVPSAQLIVWVAHAV